jgi:hypothetical protein
MGTGSVIRDIDGLWFREGGLIPSNAYVMATGLSSAELIRFRAGGFALYNAAAVGIEQPAFTGCCKGLYGIGMSNDYQQPTQVYFCALPQSGG